MATFGPTRSSTRRRRWYRGLFPVVVTVGLVIAACSDGVDRSDDQPERTVDGPERTSDDPYRDVDYDAEPIGSALRDDPANPDFPPPVIELTAIRSGGIQPDGIPAIDDPGFIPVEATGFLDDDEAVVVVEVDGMAKAYPVQILIWHEIVNDTFGEPEADPADQVPVVVTYCPLCNSALAFDRRLGDRLLDFGTSGALYQSALVMYDRQTESLWAHFTGQGLAGHYAGAELEPIAAQTVSWAEFRAAHPDGLVLSRLSTGANRRYGRNPYPSYDREDSGPLSGFFQGEVDPRLAAKARVVGIVDRAGAVAVPFAVLASRPVVSLTGDGRNLVVFHRSGLASALDSFQVSGGREVGQSGVFVAEAADGTDLTFRAADDGGFRDDQTGSTWNVLGQAVDGDLTGQSLTAVAHVDAFWFAWSSYQPATTIIETP